MAKSFDELRKTMSKASLARAEAKANIMIKEILLAEAAEAEIKLQKKTKALIASKKIDPNQQAPLQD